MQSEEVRDCSGCGLGSEANGKWQMVKLVNTTPVAVLSRDPPHLLRSFPPASDDWANDCLDVPLPGDQRRLSQILAGRLPAAAQACSAGQYVIEIYQDH